MNEKGEEAAGDPASSLPGFALLGSSREPRLTDHQTERTLLPPRGLICRGDGGAPFPLLPLPVGQLNCPTMKMKPLLL